MFFVIGTAKQHITKEHNGKLLPECRFCHEKFLTFEVMKRHRKSAHPILSYQPYHCLSCSENFRNKIDWKKHVATSVSCQQTQGVGVRTEPK